MHASGSLLANISLYFTVPSIWRTRQYAAHAQYVFLFAGMDHGAELIGQGYCRREWLPN